jgi:hypothetical protein
LVIPLGLGYHHDHWLVNQLSYKFIPNNITCVIYYEDLPYAAYMTEKRILKHVSRVRYELTPVYVSIDHELSDKITNLTLYRSQIGGSELNDVVSYASHWDQGQFYERIWVSNPLGAALGHTRAPRASRWSRTLSRSLRLLQDALCRRRR